MNIKEFLTQYTDFFSTKITSRSQINHGYCFVWAWGAYHALKSMGKNPSLYGSDDPNGAGHAWVELNGLHYDSDHLEGIDDPDVLMEECTGQYESFCCMEPHEFYRYWVRYGRQARYFEKEENREFVIGNAQKLLVTA